MKNIGFCIPCFNEEHNLELLYEELIAKTDTIEDYSFTFVFIDNSSTDNSQKILTDLAHKDKRVKVIFNNKNFGPGRSGAYAFFNTPGDAVITMACDLQDPPCLIDAFIEHWENGEKVVLGKKVSSDESKKMFFIRSLYYKIIRYFINDSDLDQITGFGLYDRSIIEEMKKAKDPNPNFRFLLSEFGFKVNFISYNQPKRLHGHSSYNFFSYLDTAIVSLISNSKKPIRLITYLGCGSSLISFIILVVLAIYMCVNRTIYIYITLYLLILFLLSLILLAIGTLGEYIMEILDRSKNRPLVIEEARINFDL